MRPYSCLAGYPIVTTNQSSANAHPSATRTRRSWALAFLASAQFLVVLDASIVNIALPNLGRDMAIGQNLLTWVVTSYVLAFGGLLLLGGRLADRYGHRRIFLMGVTGFMLASLLAALSPNIAILLAARALQGVSAALLAPAALALLMQLFPVGQGRTEAISIWGGVAGLGGVTGAILGGFLTTNLGWAAIFFINIPICLSVLLAVPFLVDKDTNLHAEQLDLPGALAITASTVSMVAAFSFALETGFLGIPTLVCALAGIVLLAIFIVIEKNTPHPLVALSIFSHRNVTIGNIVMLIVGGVTLGFFFILSLQMQMVFGLSAMATGALQLPLTLALLLTASALPALGTRLDTRYIQLISMLLMAIGLFWLSRAPVDANVMFAILCPLVVIGIGLGGAFISTTEMAVHGIAPQDSGLVSGLINTSQQIGGAFVLAIVVTLATMQTFALQGQGASDVLSLHSGYAAAYACLSALCLLAAAISSFGLRKSHPNRG